jgi:hypothetical protein
MEWIIGVCALTALVAGIGASFVLRSELLRHYNQREPIGLKLGPFMTFFFSYIYFQYHLRDIAEYRERWAPPAVSESDKQPSL